jgi:hypothetical protein
MIDSTRGPTLTTCWWTLAHVNTRSPNMGNLFVCNGHFLYERDDRDPQCGYLLSRTKDIKQ